MGDPMKKLLAVLLVFTSLVLAQGANLFERVSTIPVPLKESDGWGNFVTGFDLDGNGKVDLIAVNHNAIDTDTEFVGSMIPTIYWYEYDQTTKEWSEKWMTTITDIPLQNTWAQLIADDIDGDGKLEIIWSVVNYPSAKYNPNPNKIFIFKSNTDGTLGISDGLGGYTPNTATKVFPEDSVYYNTRPYKMFVKDIDGDGKKEIIYIDRVATSTITTKSALEVVVLGVENIPTKAGENATWTVKFTGKFDTPGYFTGTKLDGFILGNSIYAINTLSYIMGVKWDAQQNKFVTLPKQNLNTDLNLGFAVGPYYTATSVDIDGDSKEEVVLAEGRSAAAVGKVAVLIPKTDGSGFEGYKIAQMTNIVSYFDTTKGLNGCAVGDIDGDGKIDIVMGGRGLAVGQKNPNYVYRIAYKGGDIKSSQSYEVTVIDTAIHENSGQIDIIRIANIDNDSIKEVLYTSSYPRGVADYPGIPIVALKGTWVSTESVKPNTFALYQNYPNPFNPTTVISFSLTSNANVSLKVYNILGQQVATLIESQNLTAGLHKVNFNATNLPTGTYFYTLSANGNTITKKMLLVK